MNGRVTTYLVLDRLQSHTSLDRASEERDALARALAEKYAATNRNHGVLIEPFADAIAGKLRPVLLAILAGAGCVLLLACLNLANLFGAQAIGREMAIRVSLRASGLPLLRQLPTEGLTIAVLGALVGLSFGLCALNVFVSRFQDSV